MNVNFKNANKILYFKSKKISAKGIRKLKKETALKNNKFAIKQRKTFF